MIWSINTSLRFKLFGISHFVAIIIGCILIFCILFFLKLLSKKRKRFFEIFIGSISFLLPFLYIYWLYDVSLFTIKSGLPLQICSISLILCCLSLFFKNIYLINMIVYWGFIPSIIALVLPNFTFDWPHFRYYEFFISHFLIILVCLYFMIYENNSFIYKNMLLSTHHYHSHAQIRGLAVLFHNQQPLTILLFQSALHRPTMCQTQLNFH